MVKLDIIADPACPWCYVGKGYLDRALEKAGDHPFEIEYHPFQLRPDMPKGGMDRGELMEQVFGSKKRAAEAHVVLEEHAKNAGVTFNFEKITRSPNTFDAQRLIYWAGLEQRQAFVVSAIMKAYWAEGRDIGDREVLIDIAKGCEMDPEMVRRLLESDADIDSIAKREAHSRHMGITSVPTFIVGNRHAVPGAQPTELWLDVMKDIASQDREESAE